jgi:hypothetical protein
VTDPTKTDPATQELPPFLGSWRNVYLTVLLILVVYIVIMQTLTRVYA